MWLECAQLAKRVAKRVAERKAREAAAAAAAAERARVERKAAEAKAIEDAKFAAIQAECGLDAAGVRAAVSAFQLSQVPASCMMGCSLLAYPCDAGECVS